MCPYVPDAHVVFGKQYQLWNLLGAKVYGVDINTLKIEQATSVGAVQCASTLSQLTNQYFDVTKDFASDQAIV